MPLIISGDDCIKPRMIPPNYDLSFAGQTAERGRRNSPRNMYPSSASRRPKSCGSSIIGSAAGRVNQIFFARCLPLVGLENIRLQGLSQSNDARIVAGEGCCEFAQHALRETVQTVPADAAKEDRKSVG